MRWRLVLGMKSTRNQAAQRPREKGPFAWGRECANPSRSHRSLLPFSGPPYFWASLPFLVVPLLSEISVVIYPSLLFILLLHLSVIHAHPQVHVPSVILSGTLWVVVAPIALSRGHIHINGVSCRYLIRRWHLLLGLPLHHTPTASP